MRVAAQDVTVLPVDWLGSHEPGDELPVLNGTANPKFPEELLKATQIGWAEIETYVDENGRAFGKEAAGTLPCFEEAVETAAGAMAFEPARRNGAPVPARIRQVTIFNPASAAVEGPDATPRLLRANIIVDPARRVASEAFRPEPEAVWVFALIDTSGRVAEVLAPSKRLTELIGDGMRNWEFAPARQGGVPKEVTLRVPVILAAPGGLAEKVVVPARALKMVHPNFPFAAMRASVGGAVVLDYVVDPDGRAREIKVRRSSAGVFSSAAIDALRQWEFMPALSDGNPVRSRVRQTFSFTLRDEMDPDPDEGGKGVIVKKKGDPTKMPEALRFDIPPKVWRLEQPTYPYPMLAKSQKGSAQVAVVIGPDGKVAATKVVQASSPEFAYALLAAVEQFRYEPAIKDGDPTVTMITVEEKFEAKAGVENLIVSDEEREALKLELKSPGKIAKSSELDAALKPIHTPAPAYPRSLAEGVDGEAVVEFLVNEHGHPVLVRVVSASRPEFGYAAVHGVSDWHFEEPKRKGEPVTVRARVPVKFSPPEGYPNDQRISVL